ncbi:MAG: 2-isopropylmalate synthase [Oscillospiraceae bacterium]|jgi:isopropylmalate/homocitrate/citramalate synthase|nr:2-isopropylmalate synthase [Oscillospiraceae bacterium]
MKKYLTFNEVRNVLEEEPYKYELRDVAEPNLFREIYPYAEVPRIPFNHRYIGIDMPDEIWITDTTFRDGQQSRTPYTARQMVRIFNFLHELGGPKGLVRQTEFFAYSKKDQEAIYKCMEQGVEFPEVTTWIRATKKDFELVRNLGVRETGILVSCSDYHIFKKLNMTRRQAFDHYVSVVAEVIETGLVPRCHFEDITRADFYGFVIPLVSRLLELGEQAGMKVKIRLCDTLGMGVPYPGVVMPRSVPGLITGMKHFSSAESEQLEWHGHNDFSKAVVNASAAWLYGASSVNCSLLGIGERTGNVPLEAMVFEYASLRGTFDGMAPQVVTEIARYYETEIGHEIPRMTPFVGAQFNETRAGIHADGLLKDEEIYNIFDTKTLLGRPVSVAITETSGLSGLAYWFNSYYNRTESDKISKADPLIAYLKEWVDSEYAGGRQTSISSAELDALMQKFKEN